MNTNITQAAIAELKTSQTDDNSIPTQVQITHVVRQIVVNEAAINNHVSATVSGSSKHFYLV